MIKEYKKKFILSNMLLVGIVVFAILCTIFIYMYNESVDSLKNTMAQTLTPISSSEHSLGDDNPQLEHNFDDENIPFQDDSIEEPKEPPKNEERKKNKRNNNAVTVIFYNPSEDSLSVLSRSVITDETELKEAVKEISNMSDGFGELTSHGIYYYIQKTHSENKIAIASISFILSKMAELFLLLAAIFLLTMLIIFFISKKMAATAIKPLEASIAREKQFIADASHDLKTPVAVILANIGILKSKDYPPQDKDDINKWLDSTENAAHNTKHLIEEMLQLSEMDFTEKIIKTENINISDCAEKSVLFMESVAYERGISYTYDIEENIFAIANNEYVEKIFSTLIENALKYEGTGGSISTKLYKSSNKAYFSINNKSKIIPPEDIPYIFERFYRSDKSRQNTDSHGLGLAIAKRMADIIKAKISVESTENDGTTFTVCFRI